MCEQERERVLAGLSLDEGNFCRSLGHNFGGYKREENGQLETLAPSPVSVNLSRPDGRSERRYQTYRSVGWTEEEEEENEST